MSDTAEKIISQRHPESDTVAAKRAEVLEAWARLRRLASSRQEKLFGAHEIQRFNRDADETISWINEKDALISSDDCGKDLASVQTLQRKHEGVERDLAALEDKVSMLGKISHKKSLITIFGHKHKIKNFNKKFDILHKKISTALNFDFYLK